MYIYTQNTSMFGTHTRGWFAKKCGQSRLQVLRATDETAATAVTMMVCPSLLHSLWSGTPLLSVI